MSPNEFQKTSQQCSDFTSLQSKISLWTQTCLIMWSELLLVHIKALNSYHSFTLWLIYVLISKQLRPSGTSKRWVFSLRDLLNFERAFLNIFQDQRSSRYTVRSRSQRTTDLGASEEHLRCFSKTAVKWNGEQNAKHLLLLRCFSNCAQISQVYNQRSQY